MTIPGIPVEVHEGVIRTNIAQRLLRIALRNLRHLICNPRTWYTTLIAAAVWATIALLPTPATIALAALLLIGLIALWRLKPVTFRHKITLPLYATAISIRYRFKWRYVLREAGLIGPWGDPAWIKQITGNRVVKKIRIKMNIGETKHNYIYNSEEIAQSYNAHRCDIRPIKNHKGENKPRQIQLKLITKDALAQPVPRYHHTPEQLFTGLPLAQQDDLEPWLLQILGTHIVIAGETGSGKGSFFQSLIRALQPARQKGIAKIVGLDHKGGAEFMYSEHLLDEVSYESPRHSLMLLDHLNKIKENRQQRMLGSSRLWKPTPEDPAWIALCDEIGAFTSWHGSPRMKQAAAIKLSLIINQCRAYAITCAYGGQDLRKDIAVFRSQTPTQICFRMQPDDANMVFGTNAWRQGARTDEIEWPGGAYAKTKDRKNYQLIRFTNETDQMIHQDKPPDPQPRQRIEIPNAATGRRLHLNTTRRPGRKSQ